MALYPSSPLIRPARPNARRARMDTKATPALEAASQPLLQGRSTPKTATLFPAQRRKWQETRSPRAPAAPSRRSRSSLASSETHDSDGISVLRDHQRTFATKSEPRGVLRASVSIVEATKGRKIVVVGRLYWECSTP